MTQVFFQREVRAPDAATAERWLAEAFAAGASGCEERDEDGGVKWLILYLPEDALETVEEALRRAGAPAAEARPVPDRDWSEVWREGLAPIEISSRLLVRPPFVAHQAESGQETVLIEPGQAFGTGSHESTRLALELLDAWLPHLPRAPRMLDVGTGSGVLAIAAAKLGARVAVGFDLDPLATEAARGNAVMNDVAARTTFFTGAIEALAPGVFELVVANLLRREVEPILPALAARIAPGGVGILTGLLESDRADVEAGLAACGLVVTGHRLREDERGDVWLGLVARA
jgi:ribosomal protein L11 methyltransferase